MKYNTVCIVTNFRCASSSFTLLKSEEYGLPFKGEMFSHERPYSLGDVPAMWEVARTGAGHKEQHEATSAWKFYDELKKGTPCCFKIMPSHISRKEDGEEHTLLKDIVKACDKVYYLYRRDFEAQAKSWVTVRRVGDWGDTGFKKESNWGSIERAKEAHLGRLGKAETIVRKIDFDDKKQSSFVTRLSEQLMQNYIRMAELYKEIPGELVCMEDYFSEERYNPYNRKIIWDNDVKIPEFDVESLFS